MCGIVACLTRLPAAPYLVEALARMEYRGYDSAGIAVRSPEGAISTVRTIDRVDSLVDRIPELSTARESLAGIGHTRWATHGGVTVANAHPHTDCHRRIAIAHNGIIQNAATLREELICTGHHFDSDVDSEVIAHLVEDGISEHGLHTAVEIAVTRLEGSWAIVVLDAFSGSMVAAANHSPLIIARSSYGHFVASDISAIAPWIDSFQVLEDGDVVQLSTRSRWRHRGSPILARDLHFSIVQPNELSQGSHADFMSKEIEEQPEVASRIIDALGNEMFRGDLWRSLNIPDFRRVAILGCGTSLNAGRALGGLLGRLGGVPHQAIVASEAADTVIDGDTLLIALSQSGETADLLRALDAFQPNGVPVLAITNNAYSALGRRADAVIPCLAGQEVGVAATKTFTAQVLTGACVALSALVATGRLDELEVGELAEDLKRVPELLAQALEASQRTVPAIVARHASATGYVFLGRGAGTVYADEGALKLKELTYRWAESLPAGELKHGPLALIEAGTPVIVVDSTDDRLAANVAEVEARGGSVIRIGGEGSSIPALGSQGTPNKIPGIDWCGPIESVVALQIFARELALTLGRDVDKPRNLAKSVTVE